MGAIVFSLAAGALTHIVWDAATHHYGFIVANFPALKESVYHFRGGPLRVYTVLQYGGTLAGGIYLLYRYRIWYHTAPLFPENHTIHFSKYGRFSIISLIGVGGISVGIIYALIRGAVHHGTHNKYVFLRDSVLMGIPAVFIGITLFSIYCLLMEKRSDPQRQKIAPD